ncbi:MAG: SIMPL domain-containing protein [Bacteroidota bacterium]
MKKYLCLTAIILIFASKANAQQPICNPFPKTISVNGSAEMWVVPDEIYVQVTLREYQKKGQDKVDLETIKSAFLAACREARIADSLVQLASYDGYDNYWTSRKRKKPGELFTSIVYEIRFSSTSTMDALVEKLNDDATEKFEITRTSHSKMTEFRKQLKIDAVKAAKTKAIYLTEAVAEKLGEAITIKEPVEDNYVTLRSNMYANSQAVSNERYRRDEPSASTVDFKKLKIRFSVDVLFAIK